MAFSGGPFSEFRFNATEWVSLTLGAGQTPERISRNALWAAKLDGKVNVANNQLDFVGPPNAVDANSGTNLVITDENIPLTSNGAPPVITAASATRRGEGLMDVFLTGSRFDPDSTVVITAANVASVTARANTTRSTASRVTIDLAQFTAGSTATITLKTPDGQATNAFDFTIPAAQPPN